MHVKRHEGWDSLTWQATGLIVAFSAFLGQNLIEVLRLTYAGTLNRSWLFWIAVVGTFFSVLSAVIWAFNRLGVVRLPKGALTLPGVKLGCGSQILLLISIVCLFLAVPYLTLLTTSSLSGAIRLVRAVIFLLSLALAGFYYLFVNQDTDLEKPPRLLAFFATATGLPQFLITGIEYLMHPQG